MDVGHQASSTLERDNRFPVVIKVDKSDEISVICLVFYPDSRIENEYLPWQQFLA